MKINKKGFTSTTMALLGFTIVVGIWFVWNNYLNPSQNAPLPPEIKKNAQESPKPSETQTPPDEQKPAGQTASDTATWQTYRNEEYGFEFKYPENWILNHNAGRFLQINIENVPSGMEGEVGNPPKGYIGFMAQISKPRVDGAGQAHNNLSFEEFVRFLIKNPERGPAPQIMPQLTPVTIGQRSGFRVGSSFYYIDQGGGRYTTISITSPGGEQETIVDQMLSTFKFID